METSETTKKPRVPPPYKGKTRGTNLFCWCYIR
nr:MAG TPA: Stannin, MEMBRANE PROTEIN [Caudoviricetes sp.]